MLSASFENCFGDKRLDKRGNECVRRLLVKGTHAIRQISLTSAEQKGYYRFLKNKIVLLYHQIKESRRSGNFNDSQL